MTISTDDLRALRSELAARIEALDVLIGDAPKRSEPIDLDLGDHDPVSPETDMDQGARDAIKIAAPKRRKVKRRKPLRALPFTAQAIAEALASPTATEAALVLAYGSSRPFTSTEAECAVRSRWANTTMPSALHRMTKDGLILRSGERMHYLYSPALGKSGDGGAE